jgi:hypothetical protein
MCGNGRFRLPPTLLTRISIVPKASTAAAVKASTVGLLAYVRRKRQRAPSLLPDLVGRTLQLRLVQIH